MMEDAWCSNCHDPYSPVEYNVADFEGGNFCSDDCADQFENSTVYLEARFGGAPVN